MADIAVHKDRRKKFIQMLAHDGIYSGLVMLIAGFEHDKSRFIQESFFWYLTGIDEPGVIMTIDLDRSETVLFVPDFAVQRDLWAVDYVSAISSNHSDWGIDRIELLGSKFRGYSASLFFSFDHYKNLGKYLCNVLGKGKTVFTINPCSGNALVDQQVVLTGLEKEIAGFHEALKDISPYLVRMRRIKDRYEIESIFNAVDITVRAYQAAVSMIKKGMHEAEIQASAEYIITGSGADNAFPSIVAGGGRSTILHYAANSGQLADDACVLIDIGAQKHHYCADLARTYPVNGKFSVRQKELYQIVFDAHQHVLENVKPGYWLKNKLYPERSLQHIAKAYFKKYGYEQHFVHGIGHMLGLDVHDCDDLELPLEIGTVFTIEPGLYLAHEAIGIRIEDDYWLTEQGAICLSDHLAKEIIDVEESIKSNSRVYSRTF